MIRYVLIVGMMTSCWHLTMARADQPSAWPADHRVTSTANPSGTDAQTADRLRSLLNQSLIDFYLPASVDKIHGGYLEDLDEEGQFTGEVKFLTLQARQLWFFSTLAVHDIRREETLQAARSGYRFLIDHFFDQKHGGYFAKTDRAGKPTDTRKHVYLNAFALYGLVEYWRATSDPAVLQQALDLFQTLETHAYDPKHGGYHEFFTRDWQQIRDPNASGYVGAINTKTYNSHLHLLEAFTQLYRATSNETVGRRLMELVQINTVTVKHPSMRCNLDGWQPNWKPIRTAQNMRASYGHDVECAWLVLDAADALGLPSATLLGWAQSLCDHAIDRGYDREHGGFFYTGPLGEASDDRKKEWWTQSEAMVAMLTMHQLTGDKKYRMVFDQTLQFIERYQIAKPSGWWATLQADGSLGDRKSLTSMWQGAYHNGRALLLCEQMLRTPLK